jgi:hypothetical protein
MNPFFLHKKSVPIERKMMSGEIRIKETLKTTILKRQAAF